MIYLCGSFPFKLHHFMLKVPHSQVTTKGSCSLASNFKLDEELCLTLARRLYRGCWRSCNLVITSLTCVALLSGPECVECNFFVGFDVPPVSFNEVQHCSRNHAEHQLKGWEHCGGLGHHQHCEQEIVQPRILIMFINVSELDDGL